MADMNRGLDLSVFETATDAESDQFRSFYREKLGTPHRGLTKEQVYEPLFSPMVNTGPEVYSIVSRAAGDVLAADWSG